MSAKADSKTQHQKAIQNSSSIAIAKCNAIEVPDRLYAKVRKPFF